MEVGQCALLLIILGSLVIGVPSLIFGVVTVSNWWNRPPEPPTQPPKSGPANRVISYMREEARRLGITFHRVAAVCTCLLVIGLMGFGGVSAYNNVKVVDCGKGDVAIRLPDPAKRVIVSAGVPCPCGCGCNK